jgi:hypothetical protein
MGMYDYVEIECELPIPDYIPKSIIPIITRSFEENIFQTKELDCVLNNYRVSNDNRLYRSTTSWDTGDVIDQEELIDYHGIIEADMVVYLDDSNLLDTGEYLGVGANGYLTRITGPNIKRNWIYITYKLKFTDGYLVDISMISPTENELSKLI